MTFNSRLVLLLLIPALVISCSTSKSTQSTSQAAEAPEESSSDSEFKPYDEVITDEAVTDEGLFDVHAIDEELFYEIPDSVLGREILLVSRIAKTPTDYFPYVSGGSKVGEQVITFERQRNRLLLRKKSYSNVAPDSLPISKSVEANNFEPIIASFDIEAINSDSTGLVIDVTDFLYRRRARHQRSGRLPAQHVPGAPPRWQPQLH